MTKMTDKAEFVREIDTYYNDVDANGHVNSIKYIGHILDLFGIDYYREHNIKRFEIAYVAESYCGDKLSFWREQTGDNEYCIRITKKPENEEKTIEVCRCKVVFVKKWSTISTTISHRRSRTIVLEGSRCTKTLEKDYP